jgi:cytochrome c oxidase cbb3-type subunit 3
MTVLRAGVAALITVLGLAGCDALPGKPRPEDRPLLPEQIVAFDVLYASNCAGCHGAGGRLGPARPLNDPLYLALVNEDIVRSVIATGVAGTAQPAFGSSAGGSLTDRQLDIIAAGVFARWARPDSVRGLALPPYRDDEPPGDSQRGAEAYARYCAGCHGVQGTGGPQGGSIVDPAYLALVSDQALRSTVIAGRSDLGMPTWREYVPGQPMSATEIRDVVAWLASHRVAFPGQPHAERHARP